MDDALLKEFLNESREHLATIEADLLTIEEAGENIDEQLVNKVFRAAHSIKGGSSFFGFVKVKELAHKAETVLDMLRSRTMNPNPEVINVLLSAFDRLREMLGNPSESEAADISDLIVGLSGLAASYLAPERKGSLTQSVSLSTAGSNRPVTIPQVDLERAQRSGQSVYCVHYDLIHDIERKGLNLLKVFRELAETGEILDCIVDLEAAGTLDGPIGNQLPVRVVFASTLAPHIIHELVLAPPEKIEVLRDASIVVDGTLAAPPPETSTLDSEPIALPMLEPTSASPPVSEPDRPEPGPAELAAPLSNPLANPVPPQAAALPNAPVSSSNGASSSDDTLRVNVGLLESLMNLAGELVLSRNQLHVAIGLNDVQSLAAADQRLNQVTSELQDAIMRTRLQPIGNVLSKFPRVVRDMAGALRKDIQLEIRGKDVALDRSLIEGLSDPLTHMVRNAVDHGIEGPDQRVKAGKKRQGTIRIEARHEAGQVVVEIADDGKGIDPARVVESALAKGLISAEKVRSMSDQDKIALVLLPGLSTAEKVTDLSGRGVGMDVVKTNLERLGGKLDIKSEPGKGSLFRIKLPLTLAIIPCLIVSVGRERFAIPQINVEELLRIRAEDVKKRIELVGNAEVLLLRDRIIPLLHLDRLLGAKSTQAATRAGVPLPGQGKDGLEIAVVTTGVMPYALVVSAFHETEEIVVKPLGRHLKGLREYAGATVLGDGAVALILDITGVAAKAEFAAGSAPSPAVEMVQEAEGARTDEAHSLLLFHNAPDEVCATPLGTVLRIERIAPEDLETAGGRRTIQYRGASLPLVTLADAASVQSLGATKELVVVVANVHDHEVGLLAAMPVDVVEINSKIDQDTHRQTGIVGSSIIRDQTTLIVDIQELVDAVYPEWKQAKQASATAQVPSGHSAILLAEDSDFFRAQIKKYLEQDGFSVLEAADGEAAWEILSRKAQEVRALVTDIEMPRLTGLELARRLRSDGRFARLPVIALSSLAGEDDIALGKAAGVNEYLVKLDRDQLLGTLHNLAFSSGEGSERQQPGNQTMKEREQCST